MKRWLLLIVLLLLVPAFAFAKTEMENGVVTVTGEAELFAFIDWVHGYCISEPDKKPVYQTGLFHSLVIEGVKEIPENALSGFADLQMVRIADAVSIGGEAFDGCSNLIYAELPDTLTMIGDQAFFHCDKLVAADLPASLTEIGIGAFEYTALKRVELPDGIRTIKSYAFACCGQLREVILPKHMTVLAEGMFYNCDALSVIELPASLVSLGENAFGDCDGLSVIELPSGLVTIGEGAFEGCGALKEIAVPARVRRIGKDAFFSLSLQRLIFAGTPTQCEGFYQYEMEGCVNLEQIVFLDALPAWSVKLFLPRSRVYCTQAQRGAVWSDCPVRTISDVDDLPALATGNALPTAKLMANNVTPADCDAEAKKLLDELSVYRIENGWLLYQRGGRMRAVSLIPRTESVVPDGVQTLDSDFSYVDYRKAVERVIVPESVQTVTYNAFNFPNLKELRLPASLRTLGEGAFYSMGRLDTLILPPNVRLLSEIGPYELLTVFEGLRVNTLVFTSTERMILPYELNHIGFPMDGSGKLVFWDKPPEHICLSDLYDAYRNERSNFRDDIGPFTICYPKEFAEYWAPNGETRWHSLPIRQLTAEEEAAIIAENPKLFEPIEKEDNTEEPAWEYDLDANVTVFSEQGWENFQRFNWGMEIADLRIEEGIERIVYHETIDQLMPTNPVTADTLLLPSTLRSIDLTNMQLNKIEVAEGNPYLKMIGGKLYSSGGQLLWSPPDAPHPTPDLGTPLTEEEIAARLTENVISIGKVRFALGMEVSEFRAAALRAGGYEIEFPYMHYDYSAKQWGYAFQIGEERLLALADDNGEIAALTHYDANGSVIANCGGALLPRDTVKAFSERIIDKTAGDTVEWHGYTYQTTTVGGLADETGVSGVSFDGDKMYMTEPCGFARQWTSDPFIAARTIGVDFAADRALFPESDRTERLVYHGMRIEELQARYTEIDLGIRDRDGMQPYAFRAGKYILLVMTDYKVDTEEIVVNGYAVYDQSGKPIHCFDGRIVERAMAVSHVCERGGEEFWQIIGDSGLPWKEDDHVYFLDTCGFVIATHFHEGAGEFSMWVIDVFKDGTSRSIEWDHQTPAELQMRLIELLEQGAVEREGFLFDASGKELLMLVEPSETVTIPEGVETITNELWENGTNYDTVRTLIIPEGVKEIKAGAFYGFKKLERVLLPTTLEHLGTDNFCHGEMDMLLIPKRTELHPSLDTEIYGTLHSLCVHTLVFCGTDAPLVYPEFMSIAFPLDGSGRIVFYGKPPAAIDLTDLHNAYRQGGSNHLRGESGPFTICYFGEFKEYWAPNGETRWHSLPIRELTAEEEAAILAENPNLFADAGREFPYASASPDLGTPLTEAEIAARLAQAEAYRRAQSTPAPTATPIVTPQPSPTAEPVVAEETTDLRIPLLLGAIVIVAAAAVIVKKRK